jgi:hypothetical protein
MEREAHLQGILHISQNSHLSGYPVKEPKVSFMESLREMPHHYSPPSIIYQSPQYTNPPPTYHVPLGWKGAPMERDASIWRLS